MPLQVPNQPSLLPAPLPGNLHALVSPAANIVHGYNMAEQTCFHKTTVSNVIPVLTQLSALVKGIDALLQPVRALISKATTLIDDVIQVVPLTRTMLTATTTVIGAATTVVTTVTTAVGTVITLVTTVVGLVTSIIATLGGIATACLVAAIATIAAGVLFGFGFVGIGGIALTLLLTIFFFVVRGAVMGIAGLLGAVTAALTPLTTALGPLAGQLGTLTGALAPLNTAIGTVNGILSNPALPSDVTRSLAEVSTALTNLQNALAATMAPDEFTDTLDSAATTLDQRVKALQTFLDPTPAGQTKVPRTSLEDTYRDAIAIYNAGVTATQATNPVWDAVRVDPNNAPQIEPQGNLDRRLDCSTARGQG